jgi:hypothetical protein
MQIANAWHISNIGIPENDLDIFPNAFSMTYCCKVANTGGAKTESDVAKQSLGAFRTG